MGTPFTTKDPTGLEFLEYLKPYPCISGLDLSSVKDLTSFVLAWPINDKVYCYPWFFLPEDGLAEKSKTDGVPYSQWLQDGYLEVCEGSTIDGRYVTDRIGQLSKVFNIREVGFDNWGSRDIVRSLTEHGLTCIDVSQNIGSMTSPAKRLEELTLSRKLVHTGHPVLRWNMDCSTIYSDVNGNIKVIKPDLKKSTKRIDGIVALCIAISRIQKAPAAFKSVYSTRGVLSF